jgi:hypothetical protein
MIRTLPLALFAVLSAVALSACPTLKITSVKVKQGSVTATELTLVAEVEVEETEEPGADSTANANAGRGLIGLYLPAGWSVEQVRMYDPRETTARGLIAVPQAAVLLAERFPETPGPWWAFTTNTQTIPKGKWNYRLEFDLRRPKRAKSAALGVAVSEFSENLDELEAPREFLLEIKGSKAELVARTAVPNQGESEGGK